MSLARKIEQLIRKGITDTKTLRNPPSHLNAGYTSASKPYVYKILKQLRIKKVTSELPQQEPVTVGEPSPEGIITPSVQIGFKPITVPEEALQPEFEPTEGIAPEITAQAEKMVTEGRATREQVSALFKAVNKWLSPYAPDDNTADLLSEVWVSPFNRLLSRVSEGNEDLIVAGLVTLAVYSYPLYAKVNDWNRTRKQKKALTKSKQ